MDEQTKRELSFLDLASAQFRINEHRVDLADLIFLLEEQKLVNKYHCTEEMAFAFVDGNLVDCENTDLKSVLELFFQKVSEIARSKSTPEEVMRIVLGKHRDGGKDSYILVIRNDPEPKKRQRRIPFCKAFDLAQELGIVPEKSFFKEE